jgi:Resolvase, N terminal domain
MSSSRVIGIVRVSEIGDRTPDRLRSPAEQVKSMEAFCEAQGWRRLRTVDELDVSGTLPIRRGPRLASALGEIEEGKADVLLTCYFDRLVRGVGRQAELIERVEAVDGAELWSVDSGKRTNLNAARAWQSACGPSRRAAGWRGRSECRRRPRRGPQARRRGRDSTERKLGTARAVGQPLGFARSRSTCSADRNLSEVSAAAFFRV